MKTASELHSALAATLTTRDLGRLAHVLDRVESTQDEARRKAADGAPHGTLVWALEQTAGRGRLNRTWISRPGAGLWFSIVLRPTSDPDAAALLSLAAGVAVATALQEPTRGSARLKWPNDVLFEGRKLAGILAEAQTHGGELRCVILGIGLNLDPGPEGFDREIAAQAAALCEAVSGPIDMPNLLASILAELETTVDLATGDPAALRAAWLELSDTIGHTVRAQLGATTIEGRAVDLELDGSLVLETADGSRRSVRAGEVVHLRRVP